MLPSPLSNLDYQRLLADLPPPTPAQIMDFALYVADQHSWYKHLPLTPPGAPFTIYLDPGAGMQLFDHRDGGTAYQEIPADAQLFHYAMMPTAEYRRRFGCLNVRQDRSPSFRLIDASGSAHFGNAPGVLDGSAFRAIPDEFARLGTLELNGSVHPLAGRDFLWRDLLLGDEANHPGSPIAALEWPEESGGPAILQAIRRTLEHADQGGPRGVDATLKRLIAPERLRQLRQLARSAARLVERAFDVAGVVAAVESQRFEEESPLSRFESRTPEISRASIELWHATQQVLNDGAYWVVAIRHDEAHRSLVIDVTANPEICSIDVTLRFSGVSTFHSVLLDDTEVPDPDFMPSILGFETAINPRAVGITMTTCVWEALIVLA